MILIFSTAFNEGSTDDVIDWLRYNNAEFLRVNGEDFLDKDIFNYKDELISKAKVVWYRRSFNYDWMRNNLMKNKLSQFNKFGIINSCSLFSLLTNETKDYIESFYNLFSDKKWLSSYKTRHLNKPLVLERANKIGINVPEFIITTKRNELKQFKERFSGIITKAISDIGIFDGKNSSTFLYTSEVEDIENLPETFFPSFFQQKIDKEFEIRIFYLEGKFYSMAIFSQASQKTETDFRNFDDENPNRYVPYIISEKLQSQLKQLLTELNFNCASIDLIKGSDGLIYFLEINPVGQFGFVSYSCNYNLEQKIAESLIYK